MKRYVCDKVFDRVPELTGLSLVRKGSQWWGAYRLDGERHPRKDKLKVYMWRGRVWLFEEGGQAISLDQWLLSYGGRQSEQDVDRLLSGDDGYVRPSAVSRSELKYVSEESVEAMRRFGNWRNPLWRVISGMGSDMAAAWDRYGVMTDGWNNTVYWYRDSSGRVCRDKRMLYASDGHRDKTKGAWSSFKQVDGYAGHCLFGEHLLRGVSGCEVWVVESEKTAVLVAGEYGVICLATGGKGNIRQVERLRAAGHTVKLLPDYDARMDWARWGQIEAWWQWDGVDLAVLGEKCDIGDYIMAKKAKI